MLEIEGLISREEKFRALNTIFDARKPYALITIFGVLLAAASVPFILKFAVYMKKRVRHEPRYRPIRLLWDLGRSAKLDWRDRLALLLMTHHIGIKHPASVLLSLNLFDKSVVKYLGAGGHLKSKRFTRIRQHLFSQLLSTPNTSSTPLD